MGGRPVERLAELIVLNSNPKYKGEGKAANNKVTCMLHFSNVQGEGTIQLVWR